MDDDSLIKHRNQWMIKGIWIFLCLDIPLNLLLGDFKEVRGIILIAIPPLLFLTYLMRNNIFPKLTMTIISVLFISALFILNQIERHYINLFFLIMPPVFAASYRNWQNILLTTIGSAGVFSYFMLLEGENYFTQWKQTDLYYFLLCFLTYTCLKIYESKFTEGVRIQLKDELKRVNQLKTELHESKERYRAMVKQSSEGIYAFNPTTKRVVETNKRFCEMLGYKEQELLKLTLNDIILSDESIMDSNIGKVLNNNRYFVGETLYRRKDGTIITVEVGGSLVHFNNETVILANIRDITKQKEIERGLVDSEKKYRLIADNMTDFVTVLDLNGKILYASPSHENSMKIKVSNLEGGYPFKYIHPDDLETANKALSHMFINRASSQIEIRWRLENDWVNLEVRGKPVVEDNGDIQKFVVTSRNITERVKMEDQMKRTSARLEALISHMPYGILAEDKDHRLILVNHQFTEIFRAPHHSQKMLGMKSEDVPEAGRNIFREEELYKKRSKAILANRQTVLDEEWELLDGRMISRDAIPIFTNNEFDGFLWQFKDITNQKKMEQELREASFIDGLTKISNRRLFDETIATEWGRCSRTSKHLTLIMIDIDRFKNYNDTYGHQRGDECLIKVAQTIKETIRRPSDVVCRYGGEEFAVILPETHQEGGMRIAEKIRAQVEALKIPHATSSVGKFVTCSFGVATLIPSPFSTPEEIIRMADKALYSSKNKGRNCVDYYDI
ncbi:diguanylate cyclase [Bacillus sp. DNRA2]|uniref:diguanylate cyclase domain-containing protein n=1 Tax=Bacillus sp. DNRA2 TaxID=2723053 RepID=UPI00145D9441|nr:diguanylate cyclase [Bacillus sp. DNRA2]NMD72612.1 diguanylate cyclase [Bacillus sp. DNRA2]